MQKSELRKQMTERRLQLSAQDIASLSEAIARRLEASVPWHTVRTLHIYDSNERWKEVDVRYIRTTVKKMQPAIAVTVGSVQLKSPLPSSSYDLIIVPLLAFDDTLHRVGFGGGWYDRFLSSQPGAIKVGVAYDFQCVDTIHSEPHDIALDTIVTPSRVVTK